MACAHCGHVITLPTRPWPTRTSPTTPANDPATLAQLRTQDGHPRQVSAGLGALLGGQNIQSGREAEALQVWGSLRHRAAEGDAAASEDLATLTLLLVQLPAYRENGTLVCALLESALDASVLDRHRQEHRGMLCRRAVANGDRHTALLHLVSMAPASQILEMDSQYRVSLAALMTLQGQYREIPFVLGSKKDEIPIADHLDVLASVFRANAFDKAGDTARAVAALNELPASRMLREVTTGFPLLNLCANTSTTYLIASTKKASKQAVLEASRLLGVFVFIGTTMSIILCVAAVMGDHIVKWAAAAASLCTVALFMLLLRKIRRVKSAFEHGIPLTARVTAAKETGPTVNNIPYFQLTLVVDGPTAPYEATISRLMHPHVAASLIGTVLTVRANRNKLTEVYLDQA